MNYTQQPTTDSKCDSCSCKFGIHYISMDGQRTGCLSDDQREGRCHCKGFAIIYRPQVTMTPRPIQPAPNARDYYNR